MPTTRRPRRGSLQFWPKARHKGNIRVRSPRFGFAAYKVGMTHCIITDNRATSTTKGMKISIPATILECPPMKVFGIRYYKKEANTLIAMGQYLHDNLDKSLKRSITLPKKKSEHKEMDYDLIRVLVHTQPRLTGIGQKRPQIYEMNAPGKKEEQLAKAKELLGKDLLVSDVIQAGNQVDVHAVSKGKGFQGEVKRHGVALMQHKAEKRKRGKANLGPWTPHHVPYTTPQTGKMGHHLRTEYNKWVIEISNDPARVQQKGGFVSYGVVKNSYMLIKGSIAGPKKTLVKLTPAMRPSSKIPSKAPIVSYLSTESKQ